MGRCQIVSAGGSHDSGTPKEIKALESFRMDYRKEIGRRIAELRANRAWTLKDLSLKTKDLLSINRISNYETGERMPGPAEAVILAKAFGVRPAYIMAVDDTQTIISAQEEAMIRNWRTLPERDRMEYFRRLQALALTYRDPAQDLTVERALGPAPKGKKMTINGKASSPGDD